ncbi:hypothetical protein BDV37DRAFT_257058 [Aspergillus pseudonomiae]|uniref:Uncharacterized protein n=1 Tax=Aspergillus pseudonomiae TaxID=1506151 RepID=A0A5N7D472_9EURO|nr:uncharacterized protein BDV37DRAFT_257058 [Aspergillus pseudonomiae]KAE8400643.1 hypothetical protein BDV37DRAFT_257058 [Aspergillus pseudonomiae]
MYIDTLFPDGLYHPLLPRATYASCWGGLGQGECRGQSDCKGLVYTSQCSDNKGDDVWPSIKFHPHREEASNILTEKTT